MSLHPKLVFLLLSIIFGSCKTVSNEPQTKNVVTKPIAIKAFPKGIQSKTQENPPQPNVADSTFVNLGEYSQDFVYDMRYATAQNFLKSKVYDCAVCYLRLKTVKALMAANKDAMGQGYRIKLFDCYRPLDIQKRMWKIVPDPSYVADPSKGSVHNRGGAVDISLVDSNGNELDMGTDFDHFGPEAAISYERISSTAKQNRKKLRELMEKHGFTVLNSEWWHYNFSAASAEKVSNFKWDCP